MKKTTLLLIILVATGTTGLFAQAGIMDPTFGAGGKVNTAVGPGASEGWAMAIQDDWSIVVGGTAYNGTDSDFALIRYQQNGNLDSSFGTNGKVTTNFGSGSDVVYAVTLQSDGKIVAAGLSWNGTNNDFALARYNVNGTLDNTFGNSGKVTTDFASSNDMGFAVAMLDGWSIVVGGIIFNGTDYDYALARYTQYGVLDSSFGVNGKVITPMGSGDDFLTAMAIQSDSSIIVAGYAVSGSSNSFALAKYHSNGALDNSFGTNGKVITNVTSNDAEATALTMQSDGKIVIGGYIGNGVNDDFGLARYNANGTLDATFGTNGIVETAVGDSDEAIYSLAVQPDGKIIGAGSTISNVGLYKNAITRYNTDGSLDNNFGGTGIVTNVLSASNNEAYATAIQHDGKIVTAGYANDGTNDKFSVARYISGLNLGVLDFSSSVNLVLIYPNPITQSATLEYTLSKEEQISISLVDMQGKTVKTFADNQTQATGYHKQPVLLSDQIASGTYLLLISSPNGQVSIKIVK